MVIELALKGVTPFCLVACRMILAAVVCLAIWGFLGWTLYYSTKRPILPLLAIGLLIAALPFQMIS
jgi:hypothetical protein